MPYYLIFKGGVGNLEGVIIRDKTLAKAKIRAKKFFPEYRHIFDSFIGIYYKFLNR